MQTVLEQSAAAASQRVRVEDAAREIGCCPGYLRQQLRAGVWELGTVVKPPRKGGQYEYFIFREKLDKFLGLKEDKKK